MSRIRIAVIIALTSLFAAPVPASQNLSTRMRVLTGDNIGIGGFIITGNVPKHVIIRAIGPSLTSFGFTAAEVLADPMLEVRGPGAFGSIKNDNWRDSQEAQIKADGLAPTNDLESAIDATLPPGNYTALVSGKGNTIGLALVEVYDLDIPESSRLANLSTRAFVSTGNNVVIAGFIIGSNNPNDSVVIRGLGPSLTGAGVANVLADPTLELRDNNGNLLIADNDWQDDPTQAATITAAGLAPSDPKESAIAATLQPGMYTAILSGVNNGTGVGVVEVYDAGGPSFIPQHLYVGNDNTPGQVLQFNLPLTASSTSNFAIVSNNVVAVAPDASGNLAVGDNAGNLQFFTTPLSGSSTPAAAFKNGAASNNGQIAFTSAGDFWAATVSNRVNAFTHPFSNASTPSGFVTNAALVSVIGTAFDSAQNLYIANAGTGNAAACAGTSSPGGGCGSNLFVYAPPYTGAPIITPNVINYPFSSASTAYRKIAVSATRLFAASVANAPGRVDVYNLPITAASTPAFNLQTGVNTPEGLALDPAGNLYIGNLSDATVTVYSAPITAASVPSSIFKVSNGAFAIFGIAVGR
jgi:hypothetical protein